MGLDSYVYQVASISPNLIKDMPFRVYNGGSTYLVGEVLYWRKCFGIRRWFSFELGKNVSDCYAHPFEKAVLEKLLADVDSALEGKKEVWEVFQSEPFSDIQEDMEALRGTKEAITEVLDGLKDTNDLCTFLYQESW